MVSFVKSVLILISALSVSTLNSWAFNFLLKLNASLVDIANLSTCLRIYPLPIKEQDFSGN